MKKKLQVFISSTYEDLRAERQTVTEGILLAGHIPAGMELFTPTDQSQWEIIERWIKESDLLLVIIGGRYGSTHPSSGKSYTQLEVEYARQNGIPVFAIKLSDQYLITKKSKNFSLIMYENETDVPNIAAFQEFKKSFSEKYVGKVNQFELIPLIVNRSLQMFMEQDEERYHFRGWVRPDMLQTANEEEKSSKERLKELDRNFRTMIISKIEEGYFIDKMNLILDNCSYNLGDLEFIDDFVFWSSKPSNIFFNEELQNLLFNLRRVFQEYRGYLATSFFPYNGRQHFYPDLNMDINGDDMDDQNRFDFHVDVFIKITDRTIDEIRYFIRQSQIHLLS